MKIETYSTPLTVASGQTRREAEREASLLLVTEAFGPDAANTHDPEGRPQVTGADGFNGMISISHSAGTCVLAVVDEPGISIGIDTETWREQLRRVAARFMSADEVNAYNTPQLLLLAWTAKEAIYKAAHTPGLALQDIRLPLPAPDSTTFTATARSTDYIISSMNLSDTEATTVAISFN